MVSWPDRKGAEILAQLPVGWLTAMAAFATSVPCFGMYCLLRTWRSTAIVGGVSVVFLLVMTASGYLGVVPYSARQMVIMYSFGLVGVTVGAIPAGRLFRDHAAGRHQNTTGEDFVFPARHGIFMLVTLSIASLLAFLLAT
ncbi:hypothetical protein AB0N28_03955 [Streptomyces sp. NPDC051130]|uniref:hypothetical protein n=1 Tax=Streptomyces sp. NPDC051130 TaxID=3157223 RepID=UPI0034421109